MNNQVRETDENTRIRRLIDMDKSSLPADGGPHFNRLIFAASPYLLQHADNPVDWYPWGEEPFARAAREDKPVMVSIGYATCHWCHVMAHESFEDPQVAEAINRLVVPIKVDREERPDLDSLYMASARLLTGGSAGWPLNIFLTPDRHPFYAATYIPKRGGNGMLGVVETLEKLDEVWRTSRELIQQNCDAVAKALAEMTALPSSESDAGEILDRAVATLEGMYDFINGGFGDKPKFPLPHYLTFLLRMWLRTKDSNLEEIVGMTLCGMREGGIYDQLGFGFHRYAVDQQWRIPHFEKMLYDQALIAVAYLEAHQAFGDPFLKETAQEIFQFVLGEMTSPDGGFYSGLDADSEGSEGKYYVWTPARIREQLGGETGRLFCQVFGVTEDGNFEGETILHLPRTLAVVAKEHGLGERELGDLLAAARNRLLQARDGRPKPFRDEKIIAGWNGLMIAALARGAAVSGDNALLEAAERAASCLENRLRREDGRLLRICHQGEASVPAFLEDYAFLCWGMIELYQASARREHLEEALRLASGMLELFHDGSAGGFFDSGSDVHDVPVRMKGIVDGAIPSGNSIACLCLLRLGKICGDKALLEAGREALDGCLGTVKQQPVAHLQMVNALDFLLGPDLDVTLVGNGDDGALGELAAVVLRRFIPGLVLRYGADGEYEGRPAVGGRPTAYVCARGGCRPPVNSPVELESLLDEIW